MNIEYKQTDAGMIPLDWPMVSIGSVTSDFRGGANLKPSDFTYNGIKILPKSGVARRGRLKIEEKNIQFCSEYYANLHRRNQVDKTFVIVVLRDLVPSGPNIGLMVLIDTQENFLLAQGVYGFKTTSLVEPKYLVQVSNTSWYRRILNSVMVGSTQVHVTNTAFKLVQIPLPSVNEQRAIANVLFDVDNLIESLDRLILKKDMIKKSVMQKFVDNKTRTSGFKKETTVEKLGDFVQIRKGELITSKIIKPGCIPVIAGGKKPAYFHSSSNREGCNITISASGANAGFVSYHSNPIFASDCLTIGESPKYNLEFIYYTLLNLQNEIYKLQTGGAQPHIYEKDIASLKIVMLPILEQVTIVKILKDMDVEINALQQRRDKTHSIKWALMQELLTGKTRLV